MLIQVIIVIGLVIIFTISGIQRPGILPNVHQTHAGILALQTKFEAINTQQLRSFVINHHHHAYLLPLYGPCTLSFTRNGNASLAGTCQNNRKITLRPGEGGIGYQW